MDQREESASLFAADKKLTFLLLCAASFFLLFVKIELLEKSTAAFEFLADRPEGMILRVIAGLKYLSIPLIYLWKFTVIGFVIWMGCFMYGYRVTFAQCWGLVVVAEYIFLIPEVIKIVYFLFFVGDPNLYQINGFYPLSLISLYEYSDIDPKYAYPLRALNLFEIVYWFALVEGVHHFSRKEKSQAWIIVVSSYIFLFALWIWYYIIVY